MKPVMVSVFLPSLDGGGAERAFVDIANLLVADGYTVDLVLASAHGVYLPLVQAGVRVIDLKCSRVIASLPKLRAYLRRESPIAMISALSHANVVAAGAHLVARVRTNLVVSERNTIPAGVGTCSKEWILRQLSRLAYRQATTVVAVSKGVAEDLQKVIGVAPEKIKVIYNPIDTADLVKKAAEPIAHPWLRDKEPPVILGIGRLTPQKDFGTLIKAFSEVRAKHHSRLIILGDGEQRAELELLACKLGVADDIWMPGFMENPFQWMRSATVFVLSSRYEGFPNVLVQALACGARVISTDCHSGPAEILSHGYPGRLFPVGNVSALSEAIIECILEPPRGVSSVSPCYSFSKEKARDMYVQVLFGKYDPRAKYQVPS